MHKFLSFLQGKTRALLALLAGLIILVVVNWNVVERERLLNQGRFILLELAPVDPRSLMQGDYMALRFAIANQAFPTLTPRRRQLSGVTESDYPVDGKILIRVDALGIGHFEKIANVDAPVRIDQALIRFRIRNGQLKLATNAYFFEEGQAAMFDQAKYGGFRVAPNGDMILVSLHDLNRATLGKQLNEKSE
ncbi:GDYXXLXY domain-containing protein [Undibacterium fentianense]|uniref:GDYXXLXY domain-containing protein n=1 Tax=Undibacterium fentianense TaxID=2828728 RepID=A0A941E6Y0_9BURK|nr:GDYXXLXY domain-containing protein [Undibacterium fentianense]MBR7801704.1 GDYXXLXY domain-containing protein [Undibacterium fentianense]